MIFWQIGLNLSKFGHFRSLVRAAQCRITTSKTRWRRFLNVFFGSQSATYQYFPKDSYKVLIKGPTWCHKNVIMVIWRNMPVVLNSTKTLKYVETQRLRSTGINSQTQQQKKCNKFIIEMEIEPCGKFKF